MAEHNAGPEEDGNELINKKCGDQSAAAHNILRRVVSSWPSISQERLVIWQRLSMTGPAHANAALRGGCAFTTSSLYRASSASSKVG